MLALRREWIRAITYNMTDIQNKILEIVDAKHGAFWGDFIDGIPTAPENIQGALRMLIADKVLRAKEDEQEHDWEFVRRRA